MYIIYAGKKFEPYETFYFGCSPGFIRGTLGNGISRTCKCDSSMSIIEIVYDEREYTENN